LGSPAVLVVGDVVRQAASLTLPVHWPLANWAQTEAG
jgi:hypothetical protein